MNTKTCKKLIICNASKICSILSYYTNTIILVEAEIDWMSCNKMAFGDFQTNSTEVIFVNKTLDSKTCNELCKNLTTAKSYYYDGENCKCLSRSFSETGKHTKKLGAPKGCSLTFLQESCVSITFFLLKV